jgi:hypothetical protein
MRGNLLCVASSGIWTRSLALTSTCGKTLHIISWLALFTSNSFGNLYHRVLGRWLTWSCGVSEHYLTKRPHTIISIFDQFPNFSVGVFDDQSLGPHFQIKANLLNKMNLGLGLHISLNDDIFGRFSCISTQRFFVQKASTFLFRISCVLRKMKRRSK